MSALTSKADIDWRHSNVRFVPIADIRFTDNKNCLYIAAGIPTARGELADKD